MSLIEPDVIDELSVEGDHDRFTHIVLAKKGSKKRAIDIVMEARVEGFPIRALCGKQWVPQHDPAKYETCPDCVEIWEGLSGKKWGQK